MADMTSTGHDRGSTGVPCVFLLLFTVFENWLDHSESAMLGAQGCLVEQLSGPIWACPAPACPGPQGPSTPERVTTRSPREAGLQLTEHFFVEHFRGTENPPV